MSIGMSCSASALSRPYSAIASEFALITSRSQCNGPSSPILHDRKLLKVRNIMAQDARNA